MEQPQRRASVDQRFGLFDDLRRAVHGISDSVLSDRLTELATAGLIHRVVAESLQSPSATS